LKFSTYYKLAMRTEDHKDMHGYELLYAGNAISGEAGELSNKIKKIYRDHGGKLTPELIEMIKEEVGGILWYIAYLSKVTNISMDEMAKYNIDQLAQRYGI